MAHGICIQSNNIFVKVELCFEIHIPGLLGGDDFYVVAEDEICAYVQLIFQCNIDVSYLTTNRRRVPVVNSQLFIFAQMLFGEEGLVCNSIVFCISCWYIFQWQAVLLTIANLLHFVLY